MDNNNLHEENLRPEKLMNDKASALEADRTFLLEHKGDWVQVPCPSCGKHHCEHFGEKYGFSYVSCPSCATVYISPRPNEELLRKYYAISQNYSYWCKHIFPVVDKNRRDHIHRPRAVALVETCLEHRINNSLFLEVGAAYGSFCQEVALLQFFDKIIALEPTPELATVCRNKGFEVVESSIEQFEPTQQFDVIVSYEVIEHLFNPAFFIRHCTRLLKTGGLLILSCPNSEGFDMLTLGIQSNCYNHQHLNYFNPTSMKHLITQNGLRVLEITTPGKLDAELVRKAAQNGKIDLQEQPFLKKVLLDSWSTLGQSFQDFIATHGLSSHMQTICQK